MTQFSEAAVHQLTLDASWLHLLAQRLVSDPAEAEDAAQEALATALGKHGAPNDGPHPGRGWLAGVLGNVIRQNWRGARLRSEREAAAAPMRKVEPADEVAERIESRRRVVEAVAALEEPYRTAIALRFFDQLSPREIASRTGVPRKTVYTRIERGLERLRERLDRDYGGRASWMAALSPFTRLGTGPGIEPGVGSPQVHPAQAAPATPLASLSLGALTMGTALKWTTAAATAGLVFWALRTEDPSRAAEPPSAAAPRAEVQLQEPAATTAPSLVVETPSRSAQAPAAPAPEPEVSSAEPAPAPATFTGRTLGLDRRPAEGIEITFEPRSGANTTGPTPSVAGGPEDSPNSDDSGDRDGRATSDARGVFELAVPATSGRLKARGKGLAQVNAPALFGYAPVETPEIYMAPAIQVRGTVVDPGGQPLEGIDVVARLPDERAAELLGPGLGSSAPLASGVSAEDGSFTLETFGFVDGAYLQAHHAGYHTAHQPLSEGAGDGVTLVLEPVDSGEATFAGLVLDRRGRPVPDAWIATPEGSTEGDSKGRFALKLDREPTGNLRAVAEGYLPVAVAVDSIAPSRRHAVELVLGDPPLSIAGRVLDRAGEPVPDVDVWTVGGEPFGEVIRRVGDVQFQMKSSVEELAHPGGRRDRTDSEGRFELKGLLPKDYTLVAMDRRTLRLLNGPTVRAPESSLTLRLDAIEPLESISGRVLNYAGEPLSGVRLALDREAPSTSGEGRIVTPPEARTTTDAEGRFRIDPIAIEGTALVAIDTPGAVQPRFELEGRSDLDSLELRVPELCYVRVSLADPDLADGFSILDTNGEQMMFTFSVGDMRFSAAGAILGGGLSELIEINETAATLVLTKRIEEVERVTLHPRGGEIEEIRL